MKPPFGVGKEKWFTDNGFGKPRGVVHVGVNDGTELGWYLQEGQTPILGFEPEHYTFKQTSIDFADKIASGTIRLYEIALAEFDYYSFLHVPARRSDGVPATHGASLLVELAPSEEYTLYSSAWTRCLRFESFVEGEKLDVSVYDLLVIDVQGMELQVLKGFGDYLDGFKYLVVECSEQPMYNGEAPAKEVCNWLATRKFQQMTPILSHNDILFYRQQ